MNTELDDLLNTEVGEAPSPITLSKTNVPNKFPTITAAGGLRLAVVGDVSSRDDETYNQPFVGMAGRVVFNPLLNRAGLIRESLFLGTLTSESLIEDLDKFNPNVVVLLGKPTLMAAKLDATSLDAWRGSWFIGDKPGPFFGRKCIASYHPVSILRQYDWMPLLTFDLKKAKSQAYTKEWNPPQRNLITDWQPWAIVTALRHIKEFKTPISIDIEGWVHDLKCISVATSPLDSFIIPFTNTTPFEDELLIWRALADVLADPAIPKILQNSLYDRFVLQYSYSMCVLGVVDDTMPKAWEKYCELEKGLGFLCSIYTQEPYYKSDRKSDDLHTFWRYCCRDSAVTFEIRDNITLDPLGNEHYKFNVTLLNCMLYMELRGIKYDSTLAQIRLKEVLTSVHSLQALLDDVANVGVRPNENKGELLKRVRTAMCYKKDQDLPKKDFIEVYPKIKDLILTKQGDFTNEERGCISMECGFSMNIKSPEFKNLLYKKLNLPEQYAVDPQTKLKHLSVNYESLLKIHKAKPHPAVDLALQIGELRTRSQMLQITADPDNRIRCGYNIVGTETGRLTCYTSPTGSGYNLQTIPSDSSLHPLGHPLHKGMRDLFVADEGCYMFQCDLSGADGWTVAARLASLGDTTMLEDYRAGIKPAKVLCYLLRHGASSLQGKTREEIKILTGPISSKDWDYFASKIGQHGTSYLMGKNLLARQVFIQSEGKVDITPSVAEDLQRLFKIRYRVTLWHNWLANQLSKNPTLTSASGFTRRFFGRGTEILGQALAHEPQANTTYATNLAAWRLWTDVSNRTRIVTDGPATTMATIIRPKKADGNGYVKLRIQPLHQVHDALLGQFLIKDTTWATSKIKSYFDNPITIAGIKLVIPFEGNYGESWGNLKVGEIE